jgi:hypothetical protein
MLIWIGLALGAEYLDILSGPAVDANRGPGSSLAAETIDVGLEVDCSFLLVGLVTVVDIVGEIVGAVVLVDWRSPCERRFASSSRY